MMQFLAPTLIGAALFLLGWFKYRKVQASQSWPYVPGRIVEAKVDVTHNRGDEETADSTSFTPAVRYEYQIGPQIYTGDRIAFVTRSYQHPQPAQQALMAYQPGAAVWVFYNPAKPTDAVLERTAFGGRLLMSIGGVILVVVIFAAVVR